MHSESPSATPSGPRNVAITATASLRLFFDHIGPAIFFAIIPLGKIAALVSYADRGTAGRPTVLVVAYLLQQVMALGFSSFVVVLFLARRPVIGPRAPWLGRVVALAGTFAFQVPTAF